MKLSKEDLEELGFSENSFNSKASMSLNNDTVTYVTIPIEKFENGMSVKELIKYISDAVEKDIEQQMIWEQMGEEL